MTIVNEAQIDQEKEQNLPAENVEETPQEPVEEVQAEGEAEEEASPKEEENYREEYKRVRSDNYRIKNEAKAVQKENELLKNYINQSQQEALSAQQLAILHQEQSLKFQLEGAREKNKKAIEEGDTATIANSNAEMAAVAARMETLNNLKTQHNYQEQQRQEQALAEQRYYQQMMETQRQPQQPPMEAYEWLAKNRWAVQTAPEYDAARAQKVRDFVVNMDLGLAREGRQHEYYSPEYFDAIDNYARSLSSGASMQMRNDGRPVASVQNGRAGYSSSRSKNLNLSKEELEWADRMGITPEVYKKHKDLTMEKTRAVEQQRRKIGYVGY